MNSKSKIFIGILIALILLAGSCSAGFIAGNYYQQSTDSSFMVMPGLEIGTLKDIPTSGTPPDLQKLFAPFWQAWDLVHKQYVKQPVDDIALMRGAVRGMVKALGDEHSSYIEPDQYEMFKNEIMGKEYEGIGAWVDTTSEYLTIISPMIGSPAEKAGLEPGDLIIAVNGIDMTGIDGEIVRQKILGPAGTKITLTINRPGLDKSFDVTIIRANVTTSNVIGRILEDNIAYVQLVSFGDEKTLKDLRTTLDRLLEKNPAGLILDLRNNAGGLLDSAISVTSEFIDEGVIAYEQYGDGRKETFNAMSNGTATKISMVVLVNEGSASASEIVAGAIQDHNRGKLIGVKTFGKGSIQVWTELADDQGAIHITVASWLTPNKRTIQGIGLQPDVVVELTEEDQEAGRDPQLDKAIELLLINK